ncbi:MAG: Holliday junction resolvase RuvX [Anaerolineales bacterium]|nr:Holliday junction resolvase RuvX [Anaerolineales bacterium]
MRVLAVDPGDARIGIAISDPLAVIARPLMVIEHVSREDDAARILQLAEEHYVSTILVGLPLDEDGEIGPQARKSMRLVEELRRQSKFEVLPWDESSSTKLAEAMRKDDEMLDARAAAVFLQDYLNVQAA